MRHIGSGGRRRHDLRIHEVVAIVSGIRSRAACLRPGTVAVSNVTSVQQPMAKKVQNRS